MPKKYRKGATINSVTLLTMELDDGRWIYYKDRPLHPNFILNMNFATVLGGLRGGRFAIAENALLKAGESVTNL